MMSRSFAALLTAGALLITSGCGSGTSPADDVPALATSLDRVDEAIAAEDYDAARDAVAELTEVATRAEEDGDLDADQADRIVSAAESLVAALPGGEEPPAEPDPASPTSSTPASDGEEDDEDEDEPAPAPAESPGHSGDKQKGPKKSKGNGKD